MNTKVWISAFVLLITSMPLHGQIQQSPSYQQCASKAQGQLELDRCADEDSKRADAELNQTYQKLLETVKSNTKANSAIRASERLWIQYRDSYIKAMYPEDDKQAAYGSFFPMEAHLLEASLTREHVNAMNELIKQYSVP
jgi:uncharacterized protein YecT (DUF1311 family)